LYISSRRGVNKENPFDEKSRTVAAVVGEEAVEISVGDVSGWVYNGTGRENGAVDGFNTFSFSDNISRTQS
jgi:uncharacterized protein YegJ (DUF2314 family)